jgi:hypothetical protein
LPATIFLNSEGRKLVSESKHTESPWLDGGRYGNYRREVLSPGGGRAIATVWTRKRIQNGTERPTFEPFEEGVANFHLVLNAPGMFDALEALVAACEGVESSAVDDAKAVLALIKRGDK